MEYRLSNMFALTTMVTVFDSWDVCLDVTQTYASATYAIDALTFSFASIGTAAGSTKKQHDLGCQPR